MGRRLCAVWMAVLAVGAFAAGCGGSSSTPAVVAGLWSGSLSLTSDGGEMVVGPLTARLDQDGSFAAGVAEWLPLGEPQSLTVTVQGSDVTFRLSFICESFNGGVTLTGTVADDTIRVDGATGIACFGRTADVRIRAGFATLVRVPTAEPL